MSSIEVTHDAAQRRDRGDALQRLRSARGHLDAVIRMLEDERYCIDVLHQLRAVEGALSRARRAILEGHLRTCVADAYAEGRVDDVVDELLTAFFNDRAPGSSRNPGRSTTQRSEIRR